VVHESTRFDHLPGYPAHVNICLGQNKKMLEAVSKPWIRLEGKAQADEKA